MSSETTVTLNKKYFNRYTDHIAWKDSSSCKSISLNLCALVSVIVFPIFVALAITFKLMDRCAQSQNVTSLALAVRSVHTPIDNTPPTTLTELAVLCKKQMPEFYQLVIKFQLKILIDVEVEKAAYEKIMTNELGYELNNICSEKSYTPQCFSELFVKIRTKLNMQTQLLLETERQDSSDEQPSFFLMPQNKSLVSASIAIRQSNGSYLIYAERSAPPGANQQLMSLDELNKEPMNRAIYAPNFVLTQNFGNTHLPTTLPYWFGVSIPLFAALFPPPPN